MIKEFTHNVLGWARPVEKVGGDHFQSVYICECGVECTQDSQGNWFHFGEQNKI